MIGCNPFRKCRQLEALAVSDVRTARAWAPISTQAWERGHQVSPGWILDNEGAATTDPDDYLNGGSLLPLGGFEAGYKGYGLIVLTEAIVDCWP